jgi:alanyl-tRNA synthetase
MKSAAIRQAFLTFFAERNHRIVPSSSLIPYNDPTLLFSNAGMNQFKDTFLGRERRDYRRAVSSQKCMRVSGKHNDFEDVGRSFRHHTFFEMLGNFSFGDYFKREAIAYAWELITQRFGLPIRQLYVTVFENDDEAFQIWEKEIGVARDRIYRFGEKDNFWSMGETGPCGPCSEIHFDSGSSPLPGHADCDLSCSCGRYVELWNLVFMQFNRDESGAMTPLPSPSIDTGMGFERITTVLQEKRSNYDTDLFRPIIEFLCELSGLEYAENDPQGVSMRIIADHARAAAFLVGDGQYPGNDKRGYVLRKILRRAIIHGRKLGLQEPFLYRVAGMVGTMMQEAYPELGIHRETIARAVQGEEESFSHTLSSGLREFSERATAIKERGEATFPGGEAFFLYDTRGLPIETLRELSREVGLEVDEAGFELEMEKQRQRSREKAGTEKTDLGTKDYAGTTLYLGHDSHEVDNAVIQAILLQGEEVQSASEGNEVMIVLDRTPFYAESGGQVGDQGYILTGSARARVKDTQYLGSSAIGHRVVVEKGQISVGEQAAAQVDMAFRRPTQGNHTATHLLHAALRRVLGEHVKQAGSQVSADRLRFDFSHYAALSETEIEAVERLANEHIIADHVVKRIPMKLEDAVKTGAMALFGEKYREVVTVLEVDDFSRELCGGTHVHKTGEIGALKIISESSIAAGIRRVEAITGLNALERFQKSEELIAAACEKLKSTRENLLDVLDRSEGQIRELQKKVQELNSHLARAKLGSIMDKCRSIKGIQVLAARMDEITQSGLRELADELRNRLKSGVVVLGAPVNGKAALVAMVSGDLTPRLNAVKIIKAIAPLVSGGGGGKPELAEAGGKNPEKLDEALEQTYSAVDKLLD